MKPLIVGLMALSLAGSAAAQPGATQIGIGETTPGALTSDDLQSPDSTYYDLYRFRGEAGQAVVVSLSSTAFDTALTLLKGSSMTALTADDNGGGGTNAKIAFTLPAAGEYDIRATATDGGLGGYVLKVEAGPAK